MPFCHSGDQDVRVRDAMPEGLEASASRKSRTARSMLSTSPRSRSPTGRFSAATRKSTDAHCTTRASGVLRQAAERLETSGSDVPHAAQREQLEQGDVLLLAIDLPLRRESFDCQRGDSAVVQVSSGCCLQCIEHARIPSDEFRS